MIDKDIFKTQTPQNFEAVRHTFNNADLLLCSGNGLVSDSIKSATDSDFSHVGLLLKLTISNQWLVLESVESIGVRCVTLKDGYLENYMGSGKGYPGKVLIARHAQVQAQSEFFPELYRTAFSKLGDQYNNDDIFKIATRVAMNKVGIDAEGKVTAANRYICSEYVYACYQALKIQLPFNKQGFIAPATIASMPEVQPVAQLKVSESILDKIKVPLHL